MHIFISEMALAIQPNARLERVGFPGTRSIPTVVEMCRRIQDYVRGAEALMIWSPLVFETIAAYAVLAM